MKKDGIISLVSACVLLLFVLLALGSGGGDLVDQLLDTDRDYDEEEKYYKEQMRLDQEEEEKEKMEGLASTMNPWTNDNPAPQPANSDEVGFYEDEPEQTDVVAEKKYINIAGRWAGTFIFTDRTGPEYSGVTFEMGTNEEIVFSVNQASNSDQATVTLFGTECTTTFNSESRKLEFTYKTYIEGSLIVVVFKGTVASDLSTIEGTLVQTWPDGTQFKGTWRVRR